MPARSPGSERLAGRGPRRREGPRLLPPGCEEFVGLTFKEWLSCTERDDAADRIVWRDTNRDAIAGYDFDTEAAHPAAQLREDLMASVALDAIQPARMDSDDGALHIDKIIFAQQLILSRNEAMSVPYWVILHNINKL